MAMRCCFSFLGMSPFFSKRRLRSAYSNCVPKRSSFRVASGTGFFRTSPVSFYTSHLGLAGSTGLFLGRTPANEADLDSFGRLRHPTWGVSFPFKLTA
jgi:hypothetical protein